MSFGAPGSQFRDAIALIGTLLVVHAFLIVNNGLFADEWLLLQIKPGYPVQTDFLIHGAGHPFLYAYVTLANLSGHPIGFMKIMTLAAIVIGALNLKNLLVRLEIFSNFEAVIFSFLVWSYGGYQNWATKLLAAYVFSFALLCLGLNLLSIIASSDRRRVWLRFASLIAIFCSFSLNSMIAAYGIGLFAIFLTESSEQRAGRRSVLSRLIMILVVMVKRFPDFLVLPLVYWFTINHFFPKIGPYKEYYRIRIPHTDEMLSGLSDFWTWGFRKIIRYAVDVAIESPTVLVVALVIGFGFVAFVAWRHDKRPAIAADSIGAATWPALAAIVTFVICASPYLASGVQPGGHFYDTRHLVLFSIPLGLLLICAFRVVGLAVTNRAAAYCLVAIALSVNLCALWNGYFSQQARWLRQEAMIVDLRRAYPEPPAAVFNLADGFGDYPWHAYFGITDVTGALHLAWDQRPLFGFSGRSERPTILQETDKATHMEGSAFRNMDLWGPQATIELVPSKPVLGNYALARSYYLCLLRSCDTDALVDGLATTTIQVGPIPNLEPHRS
jgi:hypothetical protein